AAKGAGMDDAIPVTLKIVAIGMRRLREAASAGIFYLHRVSGQHPRSLTGAAGEVRGARIQAALLSYRFSESSLASRTLAASSFFWVDAMRSPSCSAGTVLFH